ncbi:MAG TPA: hypothetical protein VF549_12800 [Solirubrobacteraceae bacterium]
MTQHGIHDRLETKVESIYGTGDLRMIYGVGVPFLVMTGLIVAALVMQSVWLTAPLMVLIALFTVVVLQGLGHMLDDEEGEG